MTQRPRRGGDPRAAWLALPEGVQNGLERLVADNRELVRAMLEAGSDADESDLCCRCAGVMRQQNLSAAAFLARFFQADVSLRLKMYPMCFGSILCIRLRSILKPRFSGGGGGGRFCPS